MKNSDLRLSVEDELLSIMLICPDCDNFVILYIYIWTCIDMEVCQSER